MNRDVMHANYAWHQGADPSSLSDNLAGEIVIKINNAIADKGRAILAVSGGSTPKPLFQALAEHDVDWSKVIITLVDERWVDEAHSLSNAGFLKTHLLDHLPDTVRFIPLYQEAGSVEQSLPFVLNDYCRVSGSSSAQPAAFDVVILGMGSDGHTASFFPDADNIDELIDINTQTALLTCESPSTQVARVTWSLPSLLNTDFLALHITGVAKQAVFEKAAGGGDVSELPIRSVIFQDRIELNVYYAD